VPFTISHAAAAIPLRRRPLVLSALVVGTMAPDFEYFFRLTYQGRSWHTMPGLAQMTLPAAFVALVVFHLLVKWPVISLMPRSWQARVAAPARQFHWLPLSRLFWIVVSLAIGITTHVLWDGCTHLEGWAVQAWPALQETVGHAGGSNITVYKLLQHGSSILGLIILAVCVGRWYRRAEPHAIELTPLSAAQRWALALAIAFSALAAGVVKSADAFPSVAGLGALQHFVGGFVVTTITVGMGELLVFSVLWRLLFARELAREQERSWR